MYAFREDHKDATKKSNYNHQLDPCKSRYRINLDETWQMEGNQEKATLWWNFWRNRSVGPNLQRWRL